MNQQVPLDRDAIRESRLQVRRIEEHLRAQHLAVGAIEQSIGLVDVVNHPHDEALCLNYVAPRRNTAWVSQHFLEEGLLHLAKLGRKHCIWMADLLYPLAFQEVVTRMGLVAVRSAPLEVCTMDRKTPANPRLTWVRVSQPEGALLWQQRWHDPTMSFWKTPLEFLQVDSPSEAWLIYEDIACVGVALTSMHKNSAHLIALKLVANAPLGDYLADFLEAGMHALASLDINLFFISDALAEEANHLHVAHFSACGKIQLYLPPA